MEGRRVGFLHPVKLFFYSFVVQVLFGTFALWLTHDRQFEALTKLDYRIEFVGLISTIFWGGLWAVMFRMSGLNIVENMASALFFVGQTNFYGVIIDAISIPLHWIFLTASAYLVLADVGIVIVYGLFFARKLFGEPWYLILPKQLILSLLYLIIVVVVAAGGILVSGVT